MNKLVRLLPFTSFLVPFAAFAQASTDFGYLTGLATNIQTLIDAFLVPLVIALALLVFFWGVFSYFILGAGNEEKRETGKKYMLYGIIGFVVIIALWGIVQLIIQILGIGGTGAPSIPETPTR